MHAEDSAEDSAGMHTAAPLRVASFVEPLAGAAKVVWGFGDEVVPTLPTVAKSVPRAGAPLSGDEECGAAALAGWPAARPPADTAPSA